MKKFSYEENRPDYHGSGLLVKVDGEAVVGKG